MSASNSFSESTIQTVLDEAVSDYFDGCRGRIEGFITRHFRFPGAWYINKRALGWDLLRAPVNLFWAPFNMLVLLLAWLIQRLGWHRLGNLLRRVPGGLNTRVQIHIADLIYSDLLRPSDNIDGPDLLQRTLVDAFDELVEPEVHNHRVVRELEPVIADALLHYGLTRTASADISNSLMSAAIGVFAFKKFTPGGIAVGLLLASWWAQRVAIEGFFFGDFLGGLYYGLFPAQPSIGLSLVSIAVVLACLAVFASFSGLITDPIQSWTGLHKYRLNKMIDHLQKDFESNSNNTFSPKDPYLARILEILDAAKSQLL